MSKDSKQVDKRQEKIFRISREILEMKIESAKDSGELQFLVKFCREYIGTDFDAQLEEMGFETSDLISE